MAVACGVAVANLYYAQPLLPFLATSFGVPKARAAMLVTASQVGYAVGLVAVVPLGDLFERRRLAVVSLMAAALALVVSAGSQSMWALTVATVATGLTSVVAQVLVPFAADLSDPARRGRTVGVVMSGLLMGILLARSVSGLVAQVAGWRAVYVFAASATVLVAVGLGIVLPGERARERPRYKDALVMTARLMAEEPVLRVRAVYGALGFAAFSALWSTFAFVASSAPYRFSSGTIGLFGLLGVAGTLVANLAGRLVDAGREYAATGAFSLFLAVSFGLSAIGRSSLVALVAGIALLDVGVQGLQISNQAVIYKLRPDARSRITSAYMTTYFAGGALGSAAAGALYAVGGWSDVCAFGAGLGLAAIGLWAWDGHRRRSHRQAQP